MNLRKQQHQRNRNTAAADTGEISGGNNVS